MKSGYVKPKKMKVTTTGDSRVISSHNATVTHKSGNSRSNPTNKTTSSSPTTANAALISPISPTSNSASEEVPSSPSSTSVSTGQGFGGGGSGSSVDYDPNNLARGTREVTGGNITTEQMGFSGGLGMGLSREIAKDAAKNTAGFFKKNLVKVEEFALPKLSPTNNLKNLPEEVVENVLKKGDPLITKVMSLFDDVGGRYVGKTRNYVGKIAKSNKLDDALRIGNKPVNSVGDKIIPSINTKSLLGIRKQYFAAGFGLTAAFILAKESASSKVFSNFQLAEGVDKLNYARTRAVELEGEGGVIVAELDDALYDLLNQTAWQNAKSRMPWIGGNVGTAQNLESAELANAAYKKMEQIIVQGGGSAINEYDIARQEKISAEAQIVDYYNEQRVIAANNSRIADINARNEDAQFWKDYKEDLYKIEEEQNQKTADFWSEYAKKKAEYEAHEAANFGKLTFGLL